MDNDNINKIKTHVGQRNKVTITKTINGEVHKKTYKGVTINNIPAEYNHWFNYKGLTFIIS